MATIIPAEMPMPGFSFENCKRNAFLSQAGFKPPKASIFYTIYIFIYLLMIFEGYQYLVLSVFACGV
jgi:hypothetical protein